MSEPHQTSGSVEARPARMLDPGWLTVAVAAGVTVLGAAAVLGSRSLGYWASLGPGPGFFPTWLGVLLVLGGATWLVSAGRELRSSRSATSQPAPATTSGAAGDPHSQNETPEYSLPTVVAIVVSLCVLAAVLELLGYQLSMFVFLMFHLLVLGRRRLLLSLVISLAGSIGVFWVFTALLGVALPYSALPALNLVGL